MSNSKKLITLFNEKIKNNIPHATDETNTITGLINPLISTLGYDITNLQEYQREYKSEYYGTHKVDIAIFNNGSPSILFECKKYSYNFTNNNVVQLRKYYSAEKVHGNTKLSLAVLTDGIRYRFYSDILEKNLIDQDYFLEINLLNIDNLSTDIVNFLFSLSKNKIDHNSIKDFAHDRLFFNKIYSKLKSNLQAPSKDFVSFILRSIIPKNKKVTTQLIEKNKPVIRNAIQVYNNTITGNEDPIIDTPFIETIPTEVSGFQIVLFLLQKRLDIRRLKHIDTEDCFNINLDGNENKPVCSLWFNDIYNLNICFYDEHISGEKVKINNIDEIENYKIRLINTVDKYEPIIPEPDTKPKPAELTFKNGVYSGLTIEMIINGKKTRVPHGKGVFTQNNEIKKSGEFRNGKFVSGNTINAQGKIINMKKSGE